MFAVQSFRGVPESSGLTTTVSLALPAFLRASISRVERRREEAADPEHLEERGVVASSRARRAVTPFCPTVLTSVRRVVEV